MPCRWRPWLLGLLFVLVAGGLARTAGAGVLSVSGGVYTGLTVNTSVYEVNVGQAFSVLVGVYGVQDLYGADIQLTLDPEVWEVQRIEKGGVIPVDDADPDTEGVQSYEEVDLDPETPGIQGVEPFSWRDNADGTRTYTYWQTRLGAVPGASGDGTLFIVYLIPHQAGTLNLTFGPVGSGADAVVALANSGSTDPEGLPSYIPYTLADNQEAISIDFQVTQDVEDNQVDIKTQPILDRTIDVSTTRPTRLEAEANEDVTWTVTIIGPNGQGGWPVTDGPPVASREFTGSYLNVTWPIARDPGNAEVPWNQLLANGQWTFTVSARDQAGNNVSWDPMPVSVYNYPVRVPQVKILNRDLIEQYVFNPGNTYYVQIDFENLEETAVAPIVVTQVERTQGTPEFKAGGSTPVGAGQTSWFRFESVIPSRAPSDPVNGDTYTAHGMVWSNWLSGGGQAMATAAQSTFTVVPAP